MNILKNRVVAVSGAAALLVALGGVGGAVAGDLVNSHDIKNGSVRSVDVKNGTLGLRDLNSHTKGLIGQAGSDGTNGQDGATGPQGPAGPAGADGKDGVNGTDGVSGYEVVAKTVPGFSGGGWADVSCPQGKVALGGGYNIVEEKNLTSGTSIVASLPGHMNWDTNSPVRGSNDGWIVRVNKPENVNPGTIVLYVNCAAVN